MTWERFTPTEKLGKAILSIWKTGSIGLTTGAVRRYDVADYSHVVLHFDRARMAIGLELTNEPEGGGTVRIRNRSSGLSIPAKAFLEHFGLDKYRSKKFLLTKEEDSGFLVAELAEV